jgi:hypothetical protein
MTKKNPRILVTRKKILREKFPEVLSLVEIFTVVVMLYSEVVAVAAVTQKDDPPAGIGTFGL